MLYIWYLPFRHAERHWCLRRFYWRQIFERVLCKASDTYAWSSHQSHFSIILLPSEFIQSFYYERVTRSLMTSKRRETAMRKSMAALTVIVYVTYTIDLQRCERISGRAAYIGLYRHMPAKVRASRGFVKNSNTNVSRSNADSNAI